MTNEVNTTVETQAEGTQSVGESATAPSVGESSANAPGTPEETNQGEASSSDASNATESIQSEVSAPAEGESVATATEVDTSSSAQTQTSDTAPAEEVVPN